MATYRLQFCPAFTFKKAEKLLDYLFALGVSQIYASPIFAPRKGSEHGYDIINPNKINPELGGWSDFLTLNSAAKDLNLGWIQDIVPNHMAFSQENKWLWDVLQLGRRSQYYPFFDISWEHPGPGLTGKISVPFLGDYALKALQHGTLKLDFTKSMGFCLSYFEADYPLNSKSWLFLIQLLKKSLASIQAQKDVQELLGIEAELTKAASPKDDFEADNLFRQARESFLGLFYNNKEIQNQTMDLLHQLNSAPLKSQPESLIHILGQQSYRLDFWKTAAQEINYRRFFNISDLICLNMQNEDVFRHSQDLILSCLRQGLFSGIRIDHLDGLYNPKDYLQKLRQSFPSTYIFVEKILDLEEDLPEDFPVQGTTGYEFLNHLNLVFSEGKNQSELIKTYSRFYPKAQNPDLVLAESKRKVLLTEMQGELDNLLSLLLDLLAEVEMEIGPQSAKKILQELLVFFPVYRSYISPKDFSDQDGYFFTQAFTQALKSNPELQQEIFLIKDLLLENKTVSTDFQKLCQFFMRFQQLSGPLAAKGLEDTYLYNYNLLVSLNEVGGNPKHLDLGLEAFHKFNLKRLNLYPLAMNPGSTHDTKRAEDVRLRINVLSEIPHKWEKKVLFWSEINSVHKKEIAGRTAPNPNQEYFIYQSLLGALPFNISELPEFKARFKDYLLKCLREEKSETSWICPNQEFEEAVLSFAEKLLDQTGKNRFWPHFQAFQKEISWYGILNSLSCTLLRLTAPGEPDIYQGAELWDLSLVDPDNRRPVDYAKRSKMLKELKEKEKESPSHLIRILLENPNDGKIKLYLIYKALHLRKQLLDCFQKGRYIPLAAEGNHSRNLICFLRQNQDESVLTLAPRFCTQLCPQGEYPLGEKTWLETKIPLPADAPDNWFNVLTAEEIRTNQFIFTKEVLGSFPVALLKGKI